MSLMRLLAWLPLLVSTALQDSHALRFPTVLKHPFDLSHFYDENTIYWEGFKRFTNTKTTVNVGRNKWAWTRAIETSEHGGTHMDAPYHSFQTGWKIGDIPFERFFGKAVYLNLREKVEHNPDFRVTEEDFELWEKQHGPMPNGAVVLLDFGWTENYSSAEDYFGTLDISNKTSFHFPGLSEKGAKWLIDTGKVFGVGTDTASIDYGQSQLKHNPVHTVLAENNLYILEQIAFPWKPLPPKGYKIVSLPMKIRYGTGAPCRVLALPPDDLGQQFLTNNLIF